MYAFTIILFICAILQSPRFIARLYASLPGRKVQIQSDLPPPSAIPQSAIALTHSRQQVQRQVGGGGIFSGWFLQKRRLPTGLSSPTIESKEAFSDYGGDIQSPASSETPSLLPPPHINPILNHLPFARWVHGAPFLGLPAPFGSLMHMPQLVVIGLYLAVCFTALLWKTNPLPPTAARPYGNDFQRSGLVGMVQIPLVIALGVRGNIIGLCVGKGYERLKTFHKIVGRVCFLATGMHVAFWSKSLSLWHVRISVLMSSGQVGMDGQVWSILYEDVHHLGLGRMGRFGLDCRDFLTLGTKEVVHVVRVLSYHRYHLFLDGYRPTCQGRQAMVVSLIY